MTTGISVSSVTTAAAAVSTTGAVSTRETDFLAFFRLIFGAPARAAIPASVMEYPLASLTEINLSDRRDPSARVGVKAHRSFLRILVADRSEFLTIQFRTLVFSLFRTGLFSMLFFISWFKNISDLMKVKPFATIDKDNFRGIVSHDGP